MTGWLTAVDILQPPPDGDAAYWPSCPIENQFELGRVLQAARIQCEAFAPALGPSAAVPENYRIAQAYQARNLYNATIAGGTGDQIGVDGVVIAVYPLDRTIKRLLRPQTLPVVR